jgi:hypothetical protein
MGSYGDLVAEAVGSYGELWGVVREVPSVGCQGRGTRPRRFRSPDWSGMVWNGRDWRGHFNAKTQRGRGAKNAKKKL